VIDGGRVAEDGPPRELAARRSSLYARLLREERALREATWGSATWRRVRMKGGRLIGADPVPEVPARARAHGGAPSRGPS
jgi:hypothetical protein